MAVLDVLAGGGLVLLGQLITNLYQTRTRRIERREDRRTLEMDRRSEVYIRMLETAIEVRAMTISKHTDETRREYAARFRRSKAELSVHGSNEVRASFESYLELVIDTLNEFSIRQIDPNDTNTAEMDTAMDRLVADVRLDMVVGEAQRGQQDKQLPAAPPKQQ